MSVDHVLLTRFNLPSRGYESLVRAKHGWLRERLELFEAYCLPSVRSQSCRPSCWIIYFDPDSPAWLMDRVRVLSADGLFIPVLRAEVSSTQLIEDIETALGRRGEFLLTTNLDNDDGLATDFIERLRSVAPTSGARAIYLVNGLIRTHDSTYVRTDEDNAFCSVLSPWADPRTCWADWHNRLRRAMPVVHLHGDPAWLQVVHESNVSNRVHGRRVPPANYASHFPGLLTELNNPTVGDLLVDHLILGPIRSIRDVVRSAAKFVVQAISGREKIDSLRIWWSMQPLVVRSKEPDPGQSTR